MGTIDRLNAGHAAPIYVVQIEGYDRLLTTAADPAAVLSAWQASVLPGCADVTAASAGLAVDWDQEQEASPWEPFGQPPMIRLSIVPGPDATGAITDQVGIDLHKRSGGIESQLVGTMRPVTNQIAVRYSDAFDASGVAHVGPEAIAYDTNDTTTDELQDVTRGLFSPFHTETGARFARSHRGVALLPMTSDPLAIQLPPLVSSERRIWIGRWVAVWITDAPSGSYEQPGDGAHLAFAGWIAGITEGADGQTEIECEHALRKIYETRLMSEPYQAKLREGLRLSAGQTIGCSTLRAVSGGAITTHEADVLTVVTGTPTGSDEIQEGTWTAGDLGIAINEWLQDEYAAARLTFSVSFDALIDVGTGTRSGLSLSDSNTSTGGRRATLRFSDPTTARILGWTSTEATVETSSRSARALSQRPPLRFSVRVPGVDAEWTMSEPRGTWIDQSSILPPTVRDPAGLAEGVLKIGDKGYVVASQISPTLFNVEYSTAGLAPYFGEDPSAFGEITVDDPGEITVSQVIVAEGTLGDLLLRILLSTGGASHNHPTYDTLPADLSCAIPYSILGDDFVDDVATVDGTSDPISLVISEPTRFVDVFNADFILRWCFLAWGAGRLHLRSWGTPTTGSLTVDVSGAASARPVRGGSSPPFARASADERFELLRNVVTVKYGRNVDGDLAHVASFPDVESVAAHGHREIVVEARNTLAESPIGDFTGTLARFTRTLPLFSRPHKVIRAPMALPMFERLIPGTTVNVTAKGIRNPETGARYDHTLATGGLSSWPGVVVANSHTWGGARHGLGGAPPPPDEHSGDVEIMIFDRILSAPYSPAAEVDASAGSGGFSAGYNASTSTLRTVAHAYSESFDAVDASHFAAGDEIRIVEIDPAAAGSPTTWTRTVASVSGSDIVLTSGLSSPSWDAAKIYRVVSVAYLSATTTQQGDAYQADNETGLVQSSRQPIGMVASGRGQGGSVFTVAAATELPALYATTSYGDGAPLHTGAAVDSARLANNLVSYKTASQMPSLHEVSSAAAGAGVYRLIGLRPIFVGAGQLSGNQTIRLYLSPMFRSKAGASVTVRVTLARRMPQGASRDNVTRVSPYVDASWSTTSTTLTTGTVATLDTRHCDRAPTAGTAWLLVEATGDAEYAGLTRCHLGPVESP
jgi:hypothetical protein